MDINVEKVCDFILRVRALDVKEGLTDPDSGSNAIDDGARDVLVDGTDDATESELRAMVSGLNDDERAELLAILFIGRGDMEPEEFPDAVRLAREREAAGTRPADYLLGIPNVGDLLDEGLAALGLSCDV